ncbi:hypothetical protein MNBD_IGNAVI01-626 [hydrothermal vent metagenome]|uniref:Periplasmic ATP/GTP-binding protein n=1 Tax=hydrothermal vent metagenome TaxID=652676 RepID=A0A3B1CVI8_9ZZZZ
MSFNYVIIFLLFLTSLIKPQDIAYKKSLGKFENASAFSFTPSGNFYITDAGKNDIIKLDTLGNILQSIGGYGWETLTFDEPVDIYATDLRVYVTDKNNNRIQVLDKDLNYLFMLKTDGNSNDKNNFFFPTSCATSIQGDIYILDSDNSRIMKYNSEGVFLIEFGGYDSGEFQLVDPIKLGIAQDSKLFVLGDEIVTVFDQYGLGLFKLKLDFSAVNLNITFDNFVVNDEKELYYLNLRNPAKKIEKFAPPDLPEDAVIVEATIFNDRLYILTENEILVYSIIKI